MMSYNKLKRIERVRDWLKKLAYASLGLDMAISLASLASLKFYSAMSVLYYLDLALAAEVMLVIVLGLALVSLLYYDRLIENLLLNKRWKFKKKNRNGKGSFYFFE